MITSEALQYGDERLVIIESPYASRYVRRFAWIINPLMRMRNRRYARACVRDSLSRGEAPIASHLLYTQRGILCDEILEERKWGINAGLAWREVSSKTVVYIDYGISTGMQYGICAAINSGKKVEYRHIGKNAFGIFRF